MEALKEWVATIAGVVVFAGLLEMLAPSGSMKRYVQLSMGLLILLTLLRPVVGVLERTRDLAWETEAAWAAPGLSLDSVLAKAEDLRQSSAEQQVTLYRSRVEQAAAERAAAALGGRTVTARVTLGPPPKDGGAPPIQQVLLLVSGAPADAAAVTGAPADAAAANRSPAPPAPSNLVAPVEINLGPGPPKSAADRGESPEQGLDAAERAAARRAVADALGVEVGVVKIQSNS